MVINAGELDKATLELVVADDAVEKLMHDLRSMAALGLLTTTVDPANKRRYIVNTVVVVEDPNPIKTTVKREDGDAGQASTSIIHSVNYQGMLRDVSMLKVGKDATLCLVCLNQYNENMVGAVPDAKGDPVNVTCVSFDLRKGPKAVTDYWARLEWVSVHEVCMWSQHAWMVNMRGWSTCVRFLQRIDDAIATAAPQHKLMQDKISPSPRVFPLLHYEAIVYPHSWSITKAMPAAKWLRLKVRSVSDVCLSRKCRCKMHVCIRCATHTYAHHPRAHTTTHTSQKMLDMGLHGQEACEQAAKELDLPFVQVQRIVYSNSATIKRHERRTLGTTSTKKRKPPSQHQRGTVTGKSRVVALRKFLQGDVEGDAAMPGIMAANMSHKAYGQMRRNRGQGKDKQVVSLLVNIMPDGQRGVSCMT